MVEDLEARDPSLVRQLDVPSIDAEDMPLAPAVVREDFVETALRATHGSSPFAGEVLEMLGPKPQARPLDRYGEIVPRCGPVAASPRMFLDVPADVRRQPLHMLRSPRSLRGHDAAGLSSLDHPKRRKRDRNCGGHGQEPLHGRCPPVGAGTPTTSPRALTGGLSRRSAFRVTSTVAPVSARIAGHRPVSPTTVVTRKTAFNPSATRDVLADVGHGPLRQVDHGRRRRTRARAARRRRRSPARRRCRRPWRCRRRRRRAPAHR